MELLISNNIEVKKEYIGGEFVTLYVDKDQFHTAMKMLKSGGYPKEEYKSIGDIFTADSLIPSALEEKARYIYAIEQNLSNTLSSLDGVLNARVHIVLPERDKKNEIISTPSASVFIKHNPRYDLKPVIPKIKLLVSNGVNEMEFDNVSVALFPANTPTVNKRVNRGPTAIKISK